jgi:hypothetical protein
MGRLRLYGLVVSLIFTLAILALAVRSIGWADVLTCRIGHRILSAKSVAGSISFECLYFSGPAIEEFAQPHHPGGSRKLSYDPYVRVEVDDGWWRREWFTGYYSRRTPLNEFNPPEEMRSTHFTIPHWLLMIPFIAWSVWIAAKWPQETRRRIRGQCPRCGYDIRATLDRCPECGNVMSASAADEVPATGAKK